MTMMPLNRTLFRLFMIIAAFTSAHAYAQLKVVGYSLTSGNPNTIDWTKITHLNLAFENPDVNGNLSYNANNNALVEKAKANNVKVLVSICGGGQSNDETMRNRYFSLISDGNRAPFITKIVQYISSHNLDGIDLDLEGPAINSDYGKFVSDLRAALPDGKLLTAALSHLNNGDVVPSAAVQTFDYLNIMAYDSTGPWNPSAPGQHSTYEFAVTSLNWWVTNKGLLKSKAVLGVPFYGYGFGADANEGLSYDQILTRFGSGAELRDESGNKIYYNGIPTIQNKAQYVVDHGYGGIMIWQLAQDRPTSDPKSLLRTIYNTLHNVTAIDEDPDQIFTISPNPVETIAYVNILHAGFRGATITLADTTGRVLPVMVKNSNAIDVTALPSGMYVLKITKGTKTVSRKVMKR